MEEALQQIFQKVFTLQDFLRIAFSDFPSARKFTRNLENPQFLFLLENALVAPMDEISDIRFTAPIPPPEAQNWSMKRIVQECMSKGNRRGRTLRISKGKGTPHATIGFLITQEWELLLQRIGPIPIMHLLCNCHVFVPILDDDQDIHLSTATQKKFCFLQISGTPICFMKRNAKAEGMSKRDNEEIGIAASSILYKRASRPRKGFHREHVLSQCSYSHKGSIKLYHLIFNSSHAAKLPAYRRNSKRMQFAQNKLKTLLKKHKKFNYGSALLKYCKVNQEASLDSLQENDGFISQDESNSEDTISKHSRSALFAKSCSKSQVYDFLRSAIKQVVPFDCMGSERNFEMIFTKLKAILNLRKHENLTVHFLFKGFSVKEMCWLRAGRRGPFLSKSDHQQTVKLFRKWIIWIFRKFILGLLNSYFYCTEIEPLRYQLVFMRRDLWVDFQQKALEVDYQYARITQRALIDMLSSISLGFSNCRILPKANGFRLIVNMSSSPRCPLLNKGLLYKRTSVNSALKRVYQILSFEFNRQKELLGASVFGPKQSYMRYIHFIKEFKKKMPRPLYFVKMDYQNCFDSIDSDKLIEMIKLVLKEDSYVTHRISITYNDNGKMLTRYIENTLPQRESHDAVFRLQTIISKYHDAVINDNITKRDELISLLQQHLKQNVVQLSGKFYHQQFGIPQGSILSSLLCSFYLASAEREIFPFINQRSTGHSVSRLFIRQVDDSLLITECRYEAENFIRILSQGIPGYKIRINPAKTKVNFAISFGGIELNRIECGWLPWCGFRFNTKTLEVAVDMSRYRLHNISNSLSVERSKKPGLALQSRAMYFAAPKIQHIVLDPLINTRQMLLLNICRIFIIAAAKLLNYSGNLPDTPDFKLIISVSFAIINSFKKRLRQKILSSFREFHGDNFPLNRVEIEFIAWRSFRIVFSTMKKRCKLLCSQVCAEIDLLLRRIPHRFLYGDEIYKSVERIIQQEFRFLRIQFH